MKQFLNVLSFKLKTIKSSHEWSSQEKEIIDDTIERFNKMSKLKMYQNQYFDDIKTGAYKQNFNSKSNKKPNNGNHNEWKKKSNYQQPSTSKGIDQNDVHEKYSASIKKSPYQKIKTEHNLIKPLENSSEISESMCDLNNSNNFESKFKKFEHKHNSLDNIHFVPVKGSSAFTFSESRTHGRGSNNSCSQNQRNSSLNQGNMFLNHFLHTQRSKKLHGPRKSNSINFKMLKNNDTNGNNKPRKQNDNTEN